MEEKQLPRYFREEKSTLKPLPECLINIEKTVKKTVHKKKFQTVTFFNIYFLLAKFSVNLQYGPKKTRLIRCLLYGFFLFGGPEISAGHTI